MCHCNIDTLLCSSSSEFTDKIIHDIYRYVIGGVRKKLNIEWNLPSTIATAKSLPTTPITALPSNLRQVSTTNPTSEHRKIIPRSLNYDNLTASSAVLQNKASILSNVIASKTTQPTRPLLPALIPSSISQSPFNFNKILNSQYKENMLSHSTTSKGSSFGTIPEAIQSLAHNKLLKAILPASSQIFTPSTTELKASQCITSTNNCNTKLNSTCSKSIILNANLLNLIGYKNETNNAHSQDQDHVNENSPKVVCYWGDCKR